MVETPSTLKLSLSTRAGDTSSDTDSINSSSADSDSDSPDLEDMDLGQIATSQFLYLPKDDLLQLDSISSDDDGDSDSTPINLSLSTVPTVSPCPLEQSVPTITIITPEMEISYAREPYSSSVAPHLLTPHITEAQFVTVLAGDALTVIQELTDHLWIVKVYRTESVGLIPAWNVEGELERTARLNMEANCRLSSPVTEHANPGSVSSSEDGSTAGSTPATPSSTSDELSLEVSIYVADQSYHRLTKARKVQGVKSVGFVSTRRQMVFRYPSTHGQWDNSAKVEDQVATSAVWSHGWLESDAEDLSVEDDPEPSTGMKRKMSRGRKRDRRRLPIP